MTPRRPHLNLRFQRSSSAATEDSGAVYTSNIIEALDDAGLVTPAHRETMAPNIRSSATPSALEERLHEIMVFELREDGSSEYQTMTLRALYNYVVSCISRGCRNANVERVKMQSLEEQSKRRLNTEHTVRFHEEDVANSATDSVGEISQPPPTPASSLINETPGADNSSVHPPHLPSLTSSSPRSGQEGSTPLTSNNTRDTNRPSTSFRHQRQVSGAFTNLSGIINNPTVGPTRERLGGYLHPRDMRRLVTPFSGSNEPQLMVRRHVMLLNFDPLRAVVLKDRLLVLVPDGADSILIRLEKRIRGGFAELENDVFGESGSSDPRTSSKMKRNKSFEVYDPSLKAKKRLHSYVESESKQPSDDTEHTATEDDTNDDDYNEWDEVPTVDWSSVPYELHSVDAVLQTVTSMLADEARQVAQRTIDAIRELRGDSSGQDGSKGISGMPGDHAQERLRWLKDEINGMEGRVQGFVRAMSEMLDDDEDMALMNLSRLLSHPERFLQPVPLEILHEESDEPELILEAYLQQALSIVNGLDLLKAQIMTTQEQISMTLDAMRNKLLFINTLLSLASMCIASGSYIGALFGMNLRNPYEGDDATWFLKVAWGTSAGILLLFLVLAWFFFLQTSTSTNSNRRKKTW